MPLHVVYDVVVGADVTGVCVSTVVCVVCERMYRENRAFTVRGLYRVLELSLIAPVPACSIFLGVSGCRTVARARMKNRALRALYQTAMNEITAILWE